MQTIETIDSHTEGEPTRVVVRGGPDLGEGTAAERLARLRRDHDGFRSAVVNEPRGFDAMVGALLLEPQSDDACAQVIFFNNVGYLGMCVHGTIGLGATLAHLGRIGPGRHPVETPVGRVVIELARDGLIAVENVESYRCARDVAVDTELCGTVHGDVAWGGNWFFLVEDHGERIAADNLARLTAVTLDIRRSLERAGITGDDGGEIDHVELFAPPQRADADSKNFVLCPGGEYDRSPCGTGTSAKLACLAARGKLAAGARWRQESVIGSLFEGRYAQGAHGVVPTVAGRAWITGESRLLFDPGDPFREGIRRGRR